MLCAWTSPSRHLSLQDLTSQCITISEICCSRAKAKLQADKCQIWLSRGRFHLLTALAFCAALSIWLKVISYKDCSSGDG